MSAEAARRTGDRLCVNWDAVAPETFRRALGVELEHTDVTQGDLETTGRIALAHLREAPDYYDRLERLEREADAYWAGKAKPRVTRAGCQPRQSGSLRPILWALAIVAAIIIIAAVSRWARRRRWAGDSVCQLELRHRPHRANAN